MSVRLIILGLLMGGEKHPYEMQHLMKIRRMDRFIRFYDGSLYYSIDQLKEGGFIEVARIIKDTRRPDKTVYRITDAGCEEFQNLLMQQFAREEPFYDPIYTALMFARYGDSMAIAGLIDQRIKTTKNRVNVIKSLLEEYREQTSPSAHYIFIGLIEHAKADLKVLTVLRKGVFGSKLTSVVKE